MYKHRKVGESALHTLYGNCGRKPKYGREVRAAVTSLRDHKQGGSYIRSKLQVRHPELAVPCARTLQRWWSAQGVNSPRGRVEEAKKKDGAKTPTIPGK